MPPSLDECESLIADWDNCHKKLRVICCPFETIFDATLIACGPLRAYGVLAREFLAFFFSFRAQNTGWFNRSELTSSKLSSAVTLATKVDRNWSIQL